MQISPAPTGSRGLKVTCRHRRCRLSNQVTPAYLCRSGTGLQARGRSKFYLLLHSLLNPTYTELHGVTVGMVLSDLQSKHHALPHNVQTSQLLRRILSNKQSLVAALLVARPSLRPHRPSRLRASKRRPASWTIAAPHRIGRMNNRAMTRQCWDVRRHAHQSQSKLRESPRTRSKQQ